MLVILLEKHGVNNPTCLSDLCYSALTIGTEKKEKEKKKKECNKFDKQAKKHVEKIERSKLQILETILSYYI